MLLYISGSYPNNQEGIAAGAKVLLDAMIDVAGKDDFLLLTTDTKIITENIEENVDVKYELMPNWRVSKKNIKKIYSILDKYSITSVHIEYPGDLYGKTFLASFLACIVHRYNKKCKKHILVNVRLHEFSRARFLRKVAIMPILFSADRIYVPAQKDREIVSKFAKKRVHQTMIGTNIKVVSNDILSSDVITLSYFGSVYPGKGIENMLSLWKSIKEKDDERKYRFKVIGEIDTSPDNHFCEYHKQVWEWIEQYGLKDDVEVTGYISDEEVSVEIQKSQIATLLYEDGLTLRRGSFLAFLAHGIPIVTTMGDFESNELFFGHKGIKMCKDNDEMIKAIEGFSKLGFNEKREISCDNVQLSSNFEWDKIATKFLKDYGII